MNPVKNLSVLMALCAASPSVAVAQGLEPIESNYRNVRGINYLATYPSLNGQTYTTLDPNNPTGPQITLNYEGVSSSTAMWFHYTTGAGGTSTHVSDQLSWLKQSGINTVRVFLSYPAWQYFEDFPSENVVPGKNDAVRRYEHFLALCDTHGIWASPVLWDETQALGGPDPMPGTPLTNMSTWHVNPGYANITAWLGQSPQLTGTPAEAYLLDFAAASTNAPAFLFWHLMNEPAPPSIAGLQVLANYIAATLGILEANFPQQDTLLLAHLTHNDPLTSLATDPRVDLLGVHPYGVTRSWIESTVHDSTNFPDPNSPTGIMQKPVIATEIGSPGFGWSYKDAVQYAIGVPRPDLGVGETGIGYMPWVSNIGSHQHNYPFKDSNGLFYGDGKIREVAEVMAFVNAAIYQSNIYPGQTGTLFTEPALAALLKSPGDVDFLPQISVGQDRDDYAELTALLAQAPPTFATGTELVHYWNLLASTTGALFPHANPTLANPNPYAATCTGGNTYQCRPNAVDTAEFARFLDIAGFGPEWIALQPQIVSCLGLPAGTPVPNTPAAFACIRSLVIVPWQSLLTPYIVGQGGPYAYAGASILGAGCTGSNGTPNLVATAPNNFPRIGTTFSMLLSNLPNPATQNPSPFLTGMLGFGDPEPADLSVIGMPGCMLYVPGPHTNITLAYNGGSQSSNWNVVIPLDLGLVGVPLVLQAFVPDAQLGTGLPATTSNAVLATIGL